MRLSWWREGSGVTWRVVCRAERRECWLQRGARVLCCKAVWGRGPSKGGRGFLVRAYSRALHTHARTPRTHAARLTLTTASTLTHTASLISTHLHHSHHTHTASPLTPIPTQLHHSHPHPHSFTTHTHTHTASPLTPTPTWLHHSHSHPHSSTTHIHTHTASPTQLPPLHPSPSAVGAPA